jgi:hypothetical protein
MGLISIKGNIILTFTPNPDKTDSISNRATGAGLTMAMIKTFTFQQGCELGLAGFNKSCLFLSCKLLSHHQIVVQSSIAALFKP